MTHKGEVRVHNDDNYLLVNKYRELKKEEKGSFKYTSAPALFAICEGVGATRYGRKEAYYTVKSLNLESLYLDTVKEKDLITALDEMLQKINEGIVQHKVMGSEIGTTLALLYFSNEYVYVANIGDSRIYQYYNKRLAQLTFDDQEYLATDDECATASKQKVKYKMSQYLGMPKEDGRLNPRYSRHKYEEGVVKYLCCTSGVHRAISDEEILDMMTNCKSPRLFCKNIKNKAIMSHSKDNLTVIAISVRVLGRISR